MDGYIIARFVEAMALQVEAEGMVAENHRWMNDGGSPVYSESDFLWKADEIRKIGTDILSHLPKKTDEVS